MNNIYGYSRQKLEEALISMQQNKFRATQIFEWLYKKNKQSFSEMTNMGKNNIEVIQTNFDTTHLIIEKEQIASDGTRKFLFRLKDNNLIETVLMKHNYGYSVCVSSQVGCNMGCLFCASGEHKKIRNLEVYEMVLQVQQINEILALTEERVSHVVVMGIGEPFDNYDNLLEFLLVINDAKGMEIGARHITVSTCGIVPKIIEFSDFPLQVNLAISLHFARDKIRSQYMKINNAYSLKDVMESLKIYYKKTNRRITFEYILLKGINDSDKDAKDLIELIKGINCYVNLIPTNETNELFQRSSEENTKIFFNALFNSGIGVTLRKEHGHDIDAACGQLRSKYVEENIPLSSVKKHE